MAFTCDQCGVYFEVSYKCRAEPHVPLYCPFCGHGIWDRPPAEADVITNLTELAENADALEVGRRAIEDELIEYRDSRLSQLRANGLVVKEPDGTPSDTIRFGPETGLKIALRAMAEYLTRTAARRTNHRGDNEVDERLEL